MTLVSTIRNWIDDSHISLLIYSFLITLTMASNTCQSFKNPEHGTKLAEGNTEFALDLYKAIAENAKGNIFFSPGSISIALAMTYLGARNNTAKEMKSALALKELEDDHLHNAFQDLFTILGETEGNYTLHIANRLFAEKSYAFIQEFLDKQLQHYKASLAPVDFQTNWEAARSEINKWVEDQTNAKIKDLLPEGSVDSLTRMVLVNAIYFKGDWELKFDEKITSPGDFFVTPEQKIQVPMMFQKKKFNFGVARDLKDCKVLELPYKGGKMSMFILLPSTPNGIPGVISLLTKDHLVDPIKAFQMRKVEVEVTLPKFKMEQSFDLGNTLKKLGMNDLFSQGKANLSGMDGTENLFVSQVVHKAFIEVNEEGSEAAAATAVTIMLMCYIPPTQFTVNQPSLFFIQDKSTKTVLFLGMLANPSV